MLLLLLCVLTLSQCWLITMATSLGHGERCGCTHMYCKENLRGQTWDREVIQQIASKIGIHASILFASFQQDDVRATRGSYIYWGELCS